ncbi:MAG: hypothetical protein KC419_07550, partial [Anaerolineales bacterium]|nr:hypothetical protein [Anaerolineales bacterium]
ALAHEIEQARQLLPDVTISKEARGLGLRLIQEMEIDSSRAEITLFEAARAHAAADERKEVLQQDIEAVAMLSLRQRQSAFITQFFQEQKSEDEVIQTHLQKQQKKHDL